MENGFTFIDLNQFTPPVPLTNVVSSVILQAPSGETAELHRNPTAIPPTSASRLGKRQTNRRKYTDEEVQRICSMKEAGMPWRCFSKLVKLQKCSPNSKIAEHFPGRSQKSLQVSYCVNFKKRVERFQDEDVRFLTNI